MTSDLQADLDAIADDLDDALGPRHADCTCVFCDIATRLRHLLDDRGIDQAPLTSEIIAWLEVDPDHVVDAWNGDLGRCTNRGRRMDLWSARLSEHGDQRQYGYRLGVRKPATDRVRLDQIIERTLPGETNPVRYLRWNATRVSFEWSFGGLSWHPLDVAPDGTVEVLKATP